MTENINLPELPEPKYIYHNDGTEGGDDLFLFAECGAVDIGPPACEHCERLYPADQVRAAQRAAVIADRAQWQEPVWWAAALNRRATVEQWMFDAARGKRPMPTAQELRDWAITLGTPAEGEPVQQQAVPFNREYVHGYFSEILAETVGGPTDPEICALMDWLSASPTPSASESNTSGNCLMGCAAFQRGESHCDRVCLDAASEPVQDAASALLAELLRAHDAMIGAKTVGACSQADVEYSAVQNAIHAYVQRLMEKKS